MAMASMAFSIKYAYVTLAILAAGRVVWQIRVHRGPKQLWITYKNWQKAIWFNSSR
ncbi:hypothetical protein M422DRAFT_277307 [Sphaerobolus stellatus SS14]|uniref:Unplaced genomic scaffold SPHSTscaffold_1344, whole genome shotgun sequence n=1 Tax=Sphaerobolus stellatus (strain SS14) TaxID=990650 RepID=A0A0C9TKD8_SPHS4|nr:hypothetical protein M422DRAFT_277307 [Sphaerobolus stellatus SS14]